MIFAARVGIRYASSVVGFSAAYAFITSDQRLLLRESRSYLHGKVVACESAYLEPLPIVPLNLSVRGVHEHGLLFRIFRGLLRFGWIMFKLTPCIMLAPIAYFSHTAERFWWRYALWVLESSGPTAIKFAQWAGTRPDLFPQSVALSLSRLHSSSVHEYSLERTRNDLNRIYGESWPEWLELVDDAKLIGSGAIAHVSRGRIISGKWADTDVALKITHKGVREVIEADLDIMNFFGAVASRIPALTSLDLPAALDEFGKFIRSQTDLLTEAENINKFKVFFRDQPKIKFATVILEKCTSDILVESFEPGIGLGEIIRSGSTKLKKSVCDLGIQAFLKMLFVDNFVHGDLHPGNILFQPSEPSASLEELNTIKKIDGKLVLIDCGLVAQLGPKDERNFIDLMHAVVTGQSMEVGRLMIERSRSDPETVYQPDVFCEKVARLVDTTVTGKSLLFGGLEFGAVISQLLNIACQHRVRLETDFVSVACALIVLEGVGKQLDPSRNLLWEAEPYIIRQFIRRARERIRSK